MPYGIMNRIPYKLPENTLPPGTRCIQITIPDDDQWETQLYSLVLAEFGRWLMWERDVGKNGTKVASRWRVALKTWKHCDNSPVPMGTFGEDDENMPALYEPYCREDGTCGFHFRCDICGSWHDVATADQIGNPSSPSGGSPQPAPGGGTISKCTTLRANSTLLLDAPVNTGDTVEIISASGSGNDGGEIQWRCPDGGTYIGGLCDDPAFSLDSGDPVPDKPHMSLILMINGTAYPFYTGASPWTPVVITVPSGVSNAYAEIQVNDSAISNNRGDYAICYKQTNNQSVGTGWTHTFDFRVDAGGWTLVDTPIVYTWGVRSSAGYGVSDGCDEINVARRACYIERDFSSVNIDSVVVYYAGINGRDPLSDNRLSVYLSNSTHVDASCTGPSTSISPHAALTQIKIFYGVDRSDGGDCSLAGFSGSGLISRVVVHSDTGTDPF